MKARHILPSVIAIATIGCGSQFDDPTEVAQLYWTAMADGDVTEAKRFVTTATADNVELPDVEYQVEQIQLVVAEIDGDEATVPTTVAVSLGGVDLNMEFETKVEKVDGRWLIDADATRDQLAASLFESALSGALAGSMSQLQGALAELSGSMEGLGGVIGEAVGESLEGIFDGLSDASVGIGSSDRAQRRAAERARDRAAQLADRARSRAQSFSRSRSMNDGWADVDVSALPDPVVSLTGIGDDETRSAGFTMQRDGEVQVLALGEGTSSQMYDYGWIIDADTRQRVWTMELDHTDHAGGSSKNRMISDRISLDRGNYIVYYTSDGSYSPEDNWGGSSISSAPNHESYWGITVMPVDGARVASYNGSGSLGNEIASITQVGDDQSITRRFTLDRQKRVRVYAIGEISGSSSAYDYGYIRNLDTGDLVWRMTYDGTIWAGGAQRNRVANAVITLPAGDYQLGYNSDGSHSYNEWGSDAPFDPEYWGISLFEVAGR